jgi:hypothetical protein
VVETFKNECQLKRMYFSCGEVDYSKAPDVVTSSCRGVLLYFVRWEVHDPNFEATCHCGGRLIGKRWTCAQSSGKAKPMLMGGSRRAYTVSWVYECPGFEKLDPETGESSWCFCRASDTDPRRLTLIATDPEILVQVEDQLGRHVRNLYPADPAWQERGSSFDLDSFQARALESTLVTYENGDSWAKRMKVAAREEYDDHMADYLSHVGCYNASLKKLGREPRVFGNFPSFDDWLGRESPGGDTIRSRFVAMWERNKRDVERNVELQQVRLHGDPASADHTHQQMKNLNQPVPGMPLLKAVWDVVNNVTQEVVTAVCVKDTSVGRYAHAAHSVKIKRHDFTGSLFTDTWPSLEEVLMILWDMSGGRLDVFHWMRRLSKELRDSHCAFGEALAELSQAVFLRDEEDITKVDDALLSGGFGTEYTLAQIHEMKHTGTHQHF